MTQDFKYAQFRTDKPKEPGFSHELISQQYYDQYSRITDLDSMDFSSCFEGGIDTVYKLLKRLEKEKPNLPFLGTKTYKTTGIEWEWITVKDVASQAKSLACGMMKLGLLPEREAEDRIWRFVAIHAKNRVEWTVTHLANMHCKTTTIGLYDSLGITETRYIVAQTQLATICCSKDMLSRHIKMKEMDRDLPKEEQSYASVKYLVTFDSDIDEGIKDQAENAGLQIFTFDQVLMEGERNLSGFTVKEPSPQDILTISYTSGTTGDPKGVKLNHSQLVNYCFVSHESDPARLGPGDTMISYLPTAHIYEQINLAVCLFYGLRIAYYGGDPTKLISEDVRIVQPTFLPMVPRILTRLYAAIKARLDAETGCKKYLIDYALQVKLKNLRETGAVTHPCFDALIFNKIKRMLGPNLRLMFTASAPIAPEILEFLKVVFCVDILEAYGLTETVGGFMTARGDPRTGHVGGPFANVKVMLRDVPEMDMYSTDNPPRGEICFSGPTVFQGYFMRPDKTKEAFHNEWFMSGDIGIVNPNGSIKIIDRCKNIFKTAAGEYISPQKLEDIFVQSAWLDQVWVHGESIQSYILLFGVINQDKFKVWCKQNGQLAYESTLNNQDLINEVYADVKKLSKAFYLNGLEIPKGICLLSEPFSIENGLLTPTMKFKRNAARKKFMKQIEMIYAQNPNA